MLWLSNYRWVFDHLYHHRYQILLCHSELDNPCYDRNKLDNSWNWKRYTALWVHHVLQVTGQVRGYLSMCVNEIVCRIDDVDKDHSKHQLNRPSERKSLRIGISKSSNFTFALRNELLFFHIRHASITKLRTFGLSSRSITNSSLSRTFDSKCKCSSVGWLRSGQLNDVPLALHTFWMF